MALKDWQIVYKSLRISAKTLEGKKKINAKNRKVKKSQSLRSFAKSSAVLCV